MALNTNIKKNLSRFELVNWINDKCLNSSVKSIKKIDDLKTGAEFCIIMHKLYPDAIRLNRIKYNAKCEHEFMSNYKLLQNAFNKKNIPKEIPVEGIIKGRITDIFEFLKWFKDFHDNNNNKTVIKNLTISLESNNVNNINRNNNNNNNSDKHGQNNNEKGPHLSNCNQSPSSTTS